MRRHANERPIHGGRDDVRDREPSQDADSQSNSRRARADGSIDRLAVPQEGRGVLTQP